MQLFIIHFLILPIKKFKKQKLKIIFFNFLNKCNRYNIYCVSYYKGNLGKESCTYMKAYKKIISFSMRLSTKRAVIIVSPPLSEMQHLHHIQYSIIKPRHIIIHPGLFLLSPAEKSSLRGSSLTSHRHCFL